LTVVLEVVLGIVIGPHALELAKFNGFLAVMFTYARFSRQLRRCRSSSAITEVGVRPRTMESDIASALVGVALLSPMLFPAVAGILLSRSTLQTSRVEPALPA